MGGGNPFLKENQSVNLLIAHKQSIPPCDIYHIIHGHISILSMYMYILSELGVIFYSSGNTK